MVVIGKIILNLILSERYPNQTFNGIETIFDQNKILLAVDMESLCPSLV